MRTLIPDRGTTVAHEVEETGETVLYDERGGQLLVLNDSGAGIWYLLDGKRSVEEIAARVAAELDAEVEVVRGDVESFLRTLEERGIIRLQAG